MLQQVSQCMKYISHTTLCESCDSDASLRNSDIVPLGVNRSSVNDKFQLP